MTTRMGNVINKLNRTHKYNVVIEQIHDPGEDILDVGSVTINVYAHNVEEAMTTAWQSVNLDRSKYEITLIQNMNSRAAMYPEHF